MHFDKKLKTIVLCLSMVFGSLSGFASDEGEDHGDVKSHAAEEEVSHSQSKEQNHEKEDEPFDAVKMVMGHVTDGHDWHLWDTKDEHGHEHAVSIPLPIILIDGGLKMFMSSEFEHGHATVEKDGKYYRLFGATIYKSDAEGHIPLSDGGKVDVHHMKVYDAEGKEVEGVNGEESKIKESLSLASVPLDFSITKNVASMFVSVLLILLIFTSLARSYKKNDRAPKGLAAWMEPIVIFVRDDIAKANIGEKHYKRFLPFLLTLFVFIWLNNLLGLIPIFPGGANLTGNIAVTFVLAFITLIVVNFSGNKHYWGHIFWMPGVPVPMKIFMMPIELVGVIAKPFALMIRLFANITAGHVVILSLVGLTFIAKSAIVGMFGSVPLMLFISVLELLVAALQAYIFALLAALFIGMAVDEGHH